MFTISLHNLIFHSFHGVHEEENLLGNTFVVNISLSLEAGEKVTALDQTVNYASVYTLVQKRMSLATPLLETLVQDLVDKIHEFDRRIRSVTVSVEKKNPPIPNIGGTVSVSLKKDF